MIGIISYLPNELDLREIRKSNCIKVIDLIKDLFPNETINIVAQNYRDNDFISGINYISFDTGIGVSGARNIILKRFYSSSDDYLYLTDDDILMYDYYDAKQFVTDVYYGKYNIYNIDLVTSLTPDFSPFKEIIYNDDYVNMHILKRASVTSGNPCILLRNLKKFYHKEIYYKENYRIDNNMVEDIEFISNLVSEGFNAYVCVNWIKKLLNKDDSTVFNGIIESRTERNNFTKTTIESICSHYNVKNIREFNSVYNKTPKKLYVPRSTVYTITENLIPKSEKTKKKLF